MRVNAGGKFIAEWLSKRPPGLAFSSSAAVLSAHDLRGPLTFSSARKHGSPACHWAFAHSQGWRAEVINCWDRLSFATSPFFPPVRQLGAYKTMQSECLWNASASLAGWTLLVDALAPPPTPCCCCCCCRCSFRAPSIALVWSHRQRRRLKTREGSAMNKSAVNKDSQRPSFVLNSGKGTLKHQAGTTMFY